MLNETKHFKPPDFERTHQKANHKYRRQAIRYLLALLVGAAVYGLAAPENAQQTLNQAVSVAPGYYRVVEVVDGDTIEVELNGQTDIVRLIGLDTPETKDPRKPVQCFGKAATDKARELMAGGSVRLEADSSDSDRDKYKRLLRYAYLPDGTLVNAEMIKQGYAFAYTIFPFEKLDEFRELERQARQQNLGLWAGCQVDESSDVKQTQGQP
ncbi:MAG TPA: thermonuclease family protein [Candidatus Saccharimonadales bacterium]|nr:thermonuclease family protein [Candidatus Saccharimonadales bacterium]